MFVIFAIVFLVAFLSVIPLLRTPPATRMLQQRLRSVAQHSSAPGQLSTADTALLPQPSGALVSLDKRLSSYSLVRSLHTLLVQSDSTGTVAALIALTIACGAVAFALAFFLTHMLPVALVACFCIAVIPVARLRWKRTRRLHAFESGLYGCIEMLSRSLRAGHSVIGGIGIIAEQAAEPARTEFAEVFRKQNFGLPFRDALIQMLERNPSGDLRVVITAILVQKDTGGNLAEILDRTAHVISERSRIRGDIRTHTAQGRLTGWILSLLPVILFILLNIISPGYSSLLFHDPLGQKLLYGSVVLLLIGAFIVRRIVNGVEV